MKREPVPQMMTSLWTFAHIRGLHIVMQTVLETALEFNVRGCWPGYLACYCKSLKSRRKEWNESHFTTPGTSKMPATCIYDFQPFRSDGHPWCVPQYVRWALGTCEARQLQRLIEEFSHNEYWDREETTHRCTPGTFFYLSGQKLTPP